MSMPIVAREKENTMTAKVKYTCSRCAGKGIIEGFNHVMSGVCFKCGGKGYQMSKPTKPSKKWDVYAVDYSDGILKHFRTESGKKAQDVRGKCAWDLQQCAKRLGDKACWNPDTVVVVEHGTSIETKE